VTARLVTDKLVELPECADAVITDDNDREFAGIGEKRQASNLLIDLAGAARSLARGRANAEIIYRSERE